MAKAFLTYCSLTSLSLTASLNLALQHRLTRCVLCRNLVLLLVQGSVLRISAGRRLDVIAVGFRHLRDSFQSVCGSAFRGEDVSSQGDMVLPLLPHP